MSILDLNGDYDEYHVKQLLFLLLLIRIKHSFERGIELLTNCNYINLTVIIIE